MIKSLKIKNFILIDEIEIHLSPYLNIIIGETGSGKSMLLDALLILFGGRASVEFVRKGENKALIEAEIIHFNNSVSKFLSDNDLDSEEDLLLIRKEISAKGNTRNFINDTPVNLSQLKELGDILIDFHGQHEHQSLLNALNHINVLDNSSNYKELMTIYAQEYDKLKQTLNELNLILKRESDLSQRIKQRQFIYEEIVSIDPVQNEDVNLENELKLLENSELLIHSSNEIYNDLYANDNSIFSKLSEIISKINKITSFNPNIQDQVEELNSSRIITKEVANTIKTISEKIEFSSDKIEDFRLRYSKIKSLIKKYGSLDEILRLRLEIETENANIEGFDLKIQELKAELSKQQKLVGNLAFDLSRKRKTAANELSLQISELLKDMGIKYVEFETKFEVTKIQQDKASKVYCEINDEFYECSSTGIDKVEFYISTNKGQSIAPLAVVASGGEISRIMLALKKVISNSDIIDTMVFDEIDTGISGRIAQMVGSMMKQISMQKQIIAITHLPQIAALGDKNFVVKKQEESGIEISKTFELNKEEKIEEIARMLSGESISENTLQSALELINFSKQ
ncbi:MAG TPA: DNA repair protein RecN [Candidatus Kapabacteria bacterium]|nr:DNA repair protein RecN [Candidatus Kapabacteria bacterium]